MSKLNAVFQHYFDKKAAKLSHIRRGTAWYSEQHPHKDFSEFTDALSSITSEGTLRTFCVLHKGGLLHNMMGITHAMDPLLFVVASMQ